MKVISYIPSKDEMLLKFRLPKGRPTKELGRFKLWWDDKGNISAIDIMPFTEEREEFAKNLNTIKLGGIWKGMKITDEDIREAREELFQEIEGRW